jgi:hypothetical protein
MFPFLEHIETIMGLESQLPPPPVPRTEVYPWAGASMCGQIAQPRERNSQVCLEMNLQDNRYYPFATCTESNYVQCGIKKKGMKMYYDNVLKVENTAFSIPNFKHGDGV